MATATPPTTAPRRLLNLFLRRNGADRKLVGPIRGEVFGADRLAKHARSIARKHRLLPPQRGRGAGPLLERLDDTRRVLDEVHERLTAGAANGHEISPAGEWLLDNFYIVQEHIREIRTSLPGGYYQELPKLASGTLAEYPRVYDVAIELISHTEGHLTLENITLFVREYQKVAKLKMGELWAIPTMLRLGLVENIRRMALRTGARLEEVRAADTWARRLIEATDQSRETLRAELSNFVDGHPRFTPTFVARFLNQIRSYQVNFTPLVWLEQWIAEDGPGPEEAVARSNRLVALTQVTIANSITSLRTIARLDWRDFVESQSATERILRKDLSGFYPKMTFSTRDHYRHLVEQIAKRTGRAEEDIANQALGLTVTGSGRGDPRLSHVGYYLLGDGRDELEQATGFLPAFGERVYRLTQRHPNTLYFGSIATLTVLLLVAVTAIVDAPTVAANLAVLLLSLIPANEIAITVVNQLVTQLMPPHVLPKLDFRETGIPDEYRTAVVVPTLFANVKAVEEALEHIEVQFLANRDPNLLFAILSDFTDSPTQSREGDAEILDAATKGIRALNATYARDKGSTFFLFHRRRLWNPKQGVWMGWERKRGKLGQFNRFLRGRAADAFSTVEGDTASLKKVRYVITLDSDTVLPRDTAQMLVGAIAHPLNRAEYDTKQGRIVRGYGIFQPRVGVSLTSAYASRFAAIHSGHPGVDPYTTAVSDVYQDLFSEGSFTGKGIYDVDAFELATHGRFPENTLLSHDLIEGAYSRAALATDIEVFDDYPARYLTFTRRKHRWIRGDWQLLRWLSRTVPGPTGDVRNRLSKLSRWKIFDNLRRSVVEIAHVLLLTAGWLLLPGSPLLWTAVVLTAVAAPWVFSFWLAAVRPPLDQSWLAYYSAVARDALVSAQQFVLAVTFLPHQAAVSADAIVRTLVRLTITRRNLLEWQTASQVERAMARGSRREVWRRMWIVPASSAVLAVALLVLSLDAGIGATDFVATFPLLLLWFVSPSVADALSAPAVPGQVKLTGSQRESTLRYARLHWRYFEEFVSADTQWLAPDNFQEDPAPVTATRTSPTNIGLQCLATVSAYDLKFISLADMIERLENVFRSLERMRRYRGHFYNWYDLRDLHVLEPAYISTVDSGNLAGHLIALKQACLELTRSSDCTPDDALRLNAIAERARAYALEMDFKFLFDPRRKLFSIGYQQASNALDNSYYDLLASEARLASFVAIAKNDVSVDHWFRLGRSLAAASGTRVLVSWSGSMFEYLMPALVLRTFPATLLDQTHHAAVKRHIAYGHERGVPWGISESAYNVRDRGMTYQYRGFGVPDIALKRGLSRDLVVAPYATALALLVEPHQAVRNLAALESEGALGPYGFRDAIDYTRPAPGQKKAVVGAYMAHHVGMSIVAFDNALNGNVWQRRFHRDALARSTELVLQERIPRRLVLQDLEKQDDTTYVPVETTKPAVRELESPNTPQPRISLLGTLPFTTLITNAGSGLSTFRNVAVNRWRNDGTRDNYGQWCYVRDVAAARVWSAGYQPVCVEPQWYRVLFASDRATFMRRDGDIETQMEVAVAPDDAVEIRRITVFNRSAAPRDVELTSYAEVVLGPIAADRVHPAFGNLFVQTEWVEESAAILATRRQRAASEKQLWCGHVVAVRGQQVGKVTCETDRARFTGRGRSARSPAALDEAGDLSGTVGPVLDPILSLRVRVSVPANRSAEVTFATFVAEEREGALERADLYRDPYSGRRALDLSWAQAQAELRELEIAPADAALYQELAGHIVHAQPGFSVLPGGKRVSEMGQPALWALGISGDWPILLATISSAEGLPSIRQLLKAHHYWRLKGLTSDLVILNVHPPSYLQELNDELHTVVMGSNESGMLDRPGGVFIRRADILTEAEVALLRSVASVQVDSDGLGLGNFLELPESAEDAVPLPAKRQRWVRTPAWKPAPEYGPQDRAREKRNLSFFNGIGGFTERGDYEIRITRGVLPPAPWINVIANASAGCVVSESGAGAAWVRNSYFFRLTPWHNDPVQDPVGDCFYFTDAGSGHTWTPTPRPLGHARDYIVTHAPGCTRFEHTSDGVQSILTVGTGSAEPAKIELLTLTNTSAQPRTLRVTAYAEWVLGVTREQSVRHVRTEFDASCRAVLARNHFDPQYADLVAFSAISEPVAAHTTSRRAFLGRNGSLEDPIALRTNDLQTGPGEAGDPCAALQCVIALAPGESRTMVRVLGAAAGRDEALRAVTRLCNETAARTAIERFTAEWEERLSTITVRTPEPAIDLLLNRWALYQALSSRYWARTALYQSSGAYGFRDQLQDVMAFAYADPGLAREHILRCASRQFEEGDVQHWWHPQSGRGVRTRFSDDLVWLPYVVNHYLSLNGDTSILNERAPYLRMRELEPHEHELYDLPEQSDVVESVYEHCVRAFRRACTKGEHGLPLIGIGDWNDGMSRVGVLGKGESVWLAWFLITALRKFADHADARGDVAVAGELRRRADEYNVAVEESGWDGEWYRRAYYDDGTPLGSSVSDECRIDSIAQSWSVISRAGSPERQRRAMQSLYDYLVRDDAKLIMLLTPPFDRGVHDPGYIQGYVPGVRENGAQYTHAALWAVLAAALLGDGDRALYLYQLINPIMHARTPEEVAAYKVEPYVVAADVYTAEGQLGRGGWTWYTGSASWAYRVGLEGILGFTKRGEALEMDPRIPRGWPEFGVLYKYGRATYDIKVLNPNGANSGVASTVLDGREILGGIPLVDDGQRHEVIVTLAHPHQQDPMA